MDSQHRAGFGCWGLVEFVYTNKELDGLDTRIAVVKRLCVLF